MDPETKAAFENMRFYKFYPVQTPNTPDISKVKVRLQLSELCKSLYFWWSIYQILGMNCLDPDLDASCCSESFPWKQNSSATLSQLIGLFT